jgi:tetratricopeptide (TPR) repeat protein
MSQLTLHPLACSAGISCRYCPKLRSAEKAKARLDKTPKTLLVVPADYRGSPPTFAEAWYNLGDLLDEQGRSEAAIECLRTALRVAPDYADAMSNLALLLQRKNRHAEAADYWRRYLAADCQSEWAARARRSLKFCEMQVHLVACLTVKTSQATALLHC